MKARFIDPMLCRAAREVPEGDEWQYEIKLDGYRAIGVKTGGRAQLWSRNRKDFMRRFRRVAEVWSSYLTRRSSTARSSRSTVTASHRLADFGISTPTRRAS